MILVYPDTARTTDSVQVFIAGLMVGPEPEASPPARAILERLQSYGEQWRKISDRNDGLMQEELARAGRPARLAIVRDSVAVAGVQTALGPRREDPPVELRLERVSMDAMRRK